MLMKNHQYAAFTTAQHLQRILTLVHSPLCLLGPISINQICSVYNDTQTAVIQQ